MDIAGVGIAYSSLNAAPSATSVQAATSMAMLDKTLDMSSQLNQSMIQMMERSVNPEIGGNIDISV